MDTNSIVKRYNLISSRVSQGELLDSIDITDIDNISDKLSDSGKSYISTMSILSFMNPYTPVKSLALIHSTGTGKSRKALLIAGQYGKDITIVLMHNIQQRPFIKEYSKGSVFDRLYPHFNKKIESITCRSIMTAVSKNDYERLHYFLNDRVIIVDEMHHIRDKGHKKRESMQLFNTIVSVLIGYRNSIKILLTATILVDDASEIYGVHTLLKGYDHPQSDFNTVVNSLKGYVSKLDKRNLPVNEIEVKCLMVRGGEQHRLFTIHEGDKSSVYSKTLAISRFITNDDNEASEHTMTTSSIIRELNNGNEPSVDEFMTILESISTKYYNMILNILRNKGHTHFIYDSWKKRGGGDRILDILTTKQIGYKSVTNIQDAYDPNMRPKVLALHKISSKTNPKLLMDLLDIYNSAENRDGSLIEILIATPKYAESMSIQTAKYGHIVNSFWNIPVKQQVYGRINRRTSLTHVEEKDRYIQCYNYVLYDPDGLATVEYDINKQALNKYKDIYPLLGVIGEIKLESRYKSGGKYQDTFSYHNNNRINCIMRMYTPIVNYRFIDMNINSFLESLESHDNLYDTMGSSNNIDTGYSRLLSVAIQSIEHIYILDRINVAITPKQREMLDCVSGAFMNIRGYIVHILYFINNDTVEYQRLGILSKRIIRILSLDNIWIDCTDASMIKEASDIYLNITLKFTSSIYDKWRELGYYLTEYSLPSCRRLVKYKDQDKIHKQSSINIVDMRKTSRGGKWYHYDKETLVSILSKYANFDDNTKKLVKSSYNISDIFNTVHTILLEKGMVLRLPI